MLGSTYWEKQRRIFGTSIAAALLLIAGGLAAMPQKAFAATVTWDGGGNGVTFSDPQNWDSDTVPTSTDSIVICPIASRVFLDTDFTIDSQGSITIQGLGRLEI